MRRAADVALAELARLVKGMGGVWKHQMLSMGGVSAVSAPTPRTGKLVVERDWAGGGVPVMSLEEGGGSNGVTGGGGSGSVGNGHGSVQEVQLQGAGKVEEGEKWPSRAQA